MTSAHEAHPIWQRELYVPDLDALPIGAVVRDNYGTSWTKGGIGDHRWVSIIELVPGVDAFTLIGKAGPIRLDRQWARKRQQEKET